MILPTIHLNGTSPQMLLDGYLDARSAILDACSKLEHVEFNGRDYYPQGPDAFRTARDEHRARLSALMSVADQLMVICEHCSDAIAAQEAQRAR